MKSSRPSSVASGDRKSIKKNWCGFCASNRSPAEFVKSHQLRDKDGKLNCPVLLHYTCPTCGQNGHTKNFCDLNSRNQAGEAVRPGNRTSKTAYRPALRRVDLNREVRCKERISRKPRKSLISPLARPETMAGVGCQLETRLAALSIEAGLEQVTEIEVKNELPKNQLNNMDEPRYTWNQLMRAFWIGRVSLGHSLLLTADFERKFVDQLYIEAEFRLANAMIGNLNLKEFCFDDLLQQRVISDERVQSSPANA